MENPIIIVAESCHEAWANAIIHLSENSWELWNLVVRIENPFSYNIECYNIIDRFVNSKDDIVDIDKVAFTIFPQRFYEIFPDKELFYKAYNKFYGWTRKKAHSGWGTYFYRMINYQTKDGIIDQLGIAIRKIKNNEKVYGAARVMSITMPNKDLKKDYGTPCLNHMTIQIEKELEAGKKTINIMALYRNHDFRSRAYGNYIGLCNLIKYIAQETDSTVGVLTCISSHAEVPNNKKELVEAGKKILKELE